MPSLVIKNLPKPIHDQLKFEAKRNRRSVTQEAIVGLGSLYRKPVPLKFPQPVKLLKPIDPDEVVRVIRRHRDGKE
jgi:hypothetical protein